MVRLFQANCWKNLSGKLYPILNSCDIVERTAFGVRKPASESLLHHLIVVMTLNKSCNLSQSQVTHVKKMNNSYAYTSQNCCEYLHYQHPHGGTNHKSLLCSSVTVISSGGLTVEDSNFLRPEPCGCCFSQESIGRKMNRLRVRSEVFQIQIKMNMVRYTHVITTVHSTVFNVALGFEFPLLK